MGEAAMPPGFEVTVSHWLKIVGLGIEILAAIVIVIGLAWSTYLFLRRQMAEEHYDTYKIRIGRSLLLGLECAAAPVSDPATPRSAPSLPTRSLTPQLV